MDGLGFELIQHGGSRALGDGLFRLAATVIHVQNGIQLNEPRGLYAQFFLLGERLADLGFRRLLLLM